ncbi:DUF397 domain-containing protein [Streptomyces sp. NPDC005529]|uniref:DUF397 domain-containing protein n=1 Tax=unclassified Streptomyces TaxID=2593676 RepID=UPI0033A77DF8
MEPRSKTTADSSLTWFKSSYSGAEGGDCIEVATCSCGVHIRDSKDIAHPGLTVGEGAWAMFVGHAAHQGD